MKTLAFVLVIGSSACAAHATPPTQIIDSCLKTESARLASYRDISPTSFTVEEDEVQKRTSKTMVYRGRAVGIWESSQSENFGLVYSRTFIPSSKIVQIGSELPTPFVPFTAQWGTARYQKSSYLCITFNFPGLGESGSFQNVRGLYLVEMNKRLPQFYYTVGDIRNIKD